MRVCVCVRMCVCADVCVCVCVCAILQLFLSTVLGAGGLNVASVFFVDTSCITSVFVSVCVCVCVYVCVCVRSWHHLTAVCGTAICVYVLASACVTNASALLCVCASVYVCVCVWVSVCVCECVRGSHGVTEWCLSELGRWWISMQQQRVKDAAAQHTHTHTHTHKHTHTHTHTHMHTLWEHTQALVWDDDVMDDLVTVQSRHRKNRIGRLVKK